MAGVVSGFMSRQCLPGLLHQLAAGFPSVGRRVCRISKEIKLEDDLATVNMYLYYIHIYIYIHTYIPIHIYTHIHAVYLHYIHINMYVYIYTYIHIQMYS